MPVIVVAADTPLGRPIVEALLLRDGEVRAFVTDPAVADSLRELGVKVAVGDVSDPSHIAGAALNAFCAVAVGAGACDRRDRAFGDDPDTILRSWAGAFEDAGVRRVIYVDDRPSPTAVEAFRAAAPESRVVSVPGRTTASIAVEVAELDDAPPLDG